MIVFALIVVFILGLSFMNFISKNFSILEKIGFAFLLGISFETIFMFIVNIFNIRFTGNLLVIISIIFILILNFRNIKNHKILLRKLKNFKLQFPKINYKKTNLFWLFFFILICVLLYGSVAKSLYWPTFAYDNVAGYDLMGKVMGNEGKIQNSLFDINNMPILGSAKRLIYPPLVCGNFAFAYLFNMQTSKLMSSLLLIFFTVSFYSLLRKCANKTSSIIFTFFTIITPEMFAFSSLSTTNIPFAIYSSLGLICFYLWFHKNENKYLYLSSILLAFSSWARSEGVIFVTVGFIALLFNVIKNKTWKELIIYFVIGYSTFIVWTIYVRLNFNIEQSVFFPYLFWDYDKFIKVLIWVKNLTFNTSYYGICFYIFPIFLVLNIKNLFKKDETLKLLFLILIALAAYTFLFYQMDNSKMDSLNSMMKASYKRGLFAFIPIIWFYISSNKIMNSIFNKYEKFLFSK